MDLTAGIVALDCEGATIEEAVEATAFGLGGAPLGLRILDRGLAVNLDGDGDSGGASLAISMTTMMIMMLVVSVWS